MRPSVRPSLCPSVCLSVTKTLTWLISSELLKIEHWYLACMILVTSPFKWRHAVTLTFDLLQGQSCCRAGTTILRICLLLANFASVYINLSNYNTRLYYIGKVCLIMTFWPLQVTFWFSCRVRKTSWWPVNSSLVRYVYSLTYMNLVRENINHLKTVFDTHHQTCSLCLSESETGVEKGQNIWILYDLDFFAVHCLFC